MDIVKVVDEENTDKAIRYVYDHAISTKISYDTFKNFVMSCNADELPEFYILKSKGNYIGYFLFLADTMQSVPKPFTFLACHNGDKLSKENHCILLKFMIDRATKKNCNTLLNLAKYELNQLEKS